MRPEEMREGYVGWCPHVDAMATGESKGWSSTQDLKKDMMMLGNLMILWKNEVSKSKEKALVFLDYEMQPVTAQY